MFLSLEEKEMKKIAFIGTHGTRKTTYSHGLAYYLKTQGINADLLYEVARKSPLPINEDRTPSTQRWILHTQIAEELAFEKQEIDALVCDRSVLDNYAYFVEKFGRDVALDAIVKSHVKTYDLLIKVPITRDQIDDDGIRSTDKDFQRRIDETVDILLKSFGVIVVPFENIDQIVKHSLKRFGN